MESYGIKKQNKYIHPLVKLSVHLKKGINHRQASSGIHLAVEFVEVESVKSVLIPRDIIHPDKPDWNKIWS